MAAYYNEIDPYAAMWLRNLIARGHIAPGDVDERSIEDVTPDDLRNYTQCHFFAGIGAWSYALRMAGWEDSRPVWTGSCPCQPFSAAGKGGGFADERHLWPAFHHLIRECGPDVVLGEQVASKDGLAWLDLVQADLEGTGYASGAIDLCAAGVGTPHIRQRLWWVGRRLADANDASEHALLRQEPHDPVEDVRRGPVDRLDRHLAGEDQGQFSGMADSDVFAGQQGRALGRGGDPRSDAVEGAGSGGDGLVVGLANCFSFGREGIFGIGGSELDRGNDGERSQSGPRSGVEDVRLANTDSRQRYGLSEFRGPERGGENARWPESRGEFEPRHDHGGLANANGGYAGAERQQRGGEQRQQPQDGGSVRLADTESLSRADFSECAEPDQQSGAVVLLGVHDGTDGRIGGRDDSSRGAAGGAFGPGPYRSRYALDRPGPTNGFWRSADWLHCRDGKWRPVEPGTFPLAHGAASRVGRLRAYGNAIVAQAAQAFIESYIETLADF